MSLDRVILLKDEVAARLLQRQPGGTSKIVVVINNQDARLIFGHFKGSREKVCFNGSAHKFFSYGRNIGQVSVRILSGGCSFLSCGRKPDGILPLAERAA